MIERLDRTKHNRLAFSCGKETLDRFLHETAHQAFVKNVAVTYVITDSEEPDRILGFYTVSNFQIDAGEMPEVVRRRYALPNGRLPATLIGRLAVARSEQKRGLGAHLMIDAMVRCCLAASSIASTAIVVEAIDEDVVPFYEPYGFTRFSEESRKLFIMMATVRQLPLVKRRMGEVQQTEEAS
jgi:predicted GNAT family N-acyltransferase